MKKIFFLPIVLALFTFIFSNSAYAHFGSKGPFGGSISCATTFDSVVYLGAVNGGVYRSSNSQLLAWTPMPVGLKSGKITAIAHSGKYLFAGTLDSGLYIFNGFIGTDQYWVKINNGISNLKIKSLVALDSITLLAGTDGGGLFKTTDKGANWMAVSNAAFTNGSVTSLLKINNRVFASTLAGGVFLSTDNGSTWASFNDANTLNIDSTTSLTYNSTTDELAVINKNGVFIATKASTTTVASYALAQLGIPTGTILRAISNNGTNWFLATDKGLYSSVAGTIQWSAVNAGLTTTDVTTVISFRTNLIVGTNKQGIFKSAASTISWAATNTGFNNLVTYSIETSGNQVVVAATERGVFVSTDLAATYISANKGLSDSLNVNYLKFFGTLLYAGTKNGGIFVSADTGKTWASINTGLTSLNIKKIFASSTTVYLIDATNGLYQLSGSSWASIQAGLGANAVPTSMMFYDTKILLGTLGQGVFIREVSNGTWTTANSGLTNLNVTSVTRTAKSTKLFVGTDGSGVFSSDLAILNWKQVTPVAIAHTATMGLDGSKILDMSFNGGYVFASYKGGLLATSDSGATWIAGGNQFNLPSYSNINRISFVTTRVFVVTENNCLYSNALTELPVLTGTTDFNAAVNAAVEVIPNPNNGQFSVSLKDLTSKIKEVSIYNASGQLMQHLLNTGNLETLGLSTNFPTGIYFIQIGTDNGLATKKFVIQ